MPTTSPTSTVGGFEASGSRDARYLAMYSTSLLSITLSRYTSPLLRTVSSMLAELSELFTLSVAVITSRFVSLIPAFAVTFTVQTSVVPMRSIGWTSDPPIDERSIVTPETPLSASVTVAVTVVTSVPGALALPLPLSITSRLVAAFSTTGGTVSVMMVNNPSVTAWSIGL